MRGRCASTRSARAGRSSASGSVTAAAVTAGLVIDDALARAAGAERNASSRPRAPGKHSARLRIPVVARAANSAILQVRGPRRATDRRRRGRAGWPRGARSSRWARAAVRQTSTSGCGVVARVGVGVGGVRPRTRLDPAQDGKEHRVVHAVGRAPRSPRRRRGAGRARSRGVVQGARPVARGRGHRLRDRPIASTRTSTWYAVGSASSSSV